MSQLGLFMLRKATALLACILLFHILSAFTADFTGPVVSILDDDMLEVLHNNHAERIRLRSCNHIFPSFTHSPHARPRHCTHACIESKIPFQYILMVMVNVTPRGKTNAVRTIR